MVNPEPAEHVHHWNFVDSCTDPSCHARRCRYLFRLGTGLRFRRQYGQCSRVAEPDRQHCARHAQEREHVA